MVVILGTLAGMVMFGLGLILLIALWPVLWLAFAANRAFGRRAALWTAAFTLGASYALLETAHSNGPGGLWTWVYFVAPPLVALDWRAGANRAWSSTRTRARQLRPRRLLIGDLFDGDDRNSASITSYFHRGQHHIRGQRFAWARGFTSWSL